MRSTECRIKHQPEAHCNVLPSGTDLSQRVDTVQEENLKLRSENQVLGQYIESLMSASSVFQPTSPKNKKKVNR